MMGSCQISLCTNNTSLTKAGEGQGRAPGQASDYTLWAPNPLDSHIHDQAFYQDFGHPNSTYGKVNNRHIRIWVQVMFLTYFLYFAGQT